MRFIFCFTFCPMRLIGPTRITLALTAGLLALAAADDVSDSDHDHTHVVACAMACMPMQGASGAVG